MQLRTKWGALVLVILLLGSLGTTGLVVAQSNSSAPVAQTSASLPAALQKEPLNPAFVQYQQNKSAGKVATQTVDGLGLGWVPPPYELSKLPTATSLAQAQAYPATYDLRTMNKVSPVENQGSCGSCWTFATFGSLESYLLPGLTTQYSENNLKNFADFDYTCCVGGDSAMSTAYLARWGTTMTDATGSTIHGGPVTSASDPYSDSSCTSSATTSQAAMHVQNVYFLPLKQSPTDNSAIKSALMTYGGVYTAFYWAGASSSTTSYWNQATAAYYDGSATTANHAVTIVGWDDNFSAKNFSTIPSGNGAWICKNSWGTSFGKSGYFYVSYYDNNMGYQENTVFTAEPTTNYTTNYQYDPFGMESTIGSGSSPTAYGANVFTANSTGTLKAVSFWAPVQGTQYTAQVYVSPTSSSIPTSGTLMSTISGTVSYAGYYTESLSPTVNLTKGETFAVVVKFTTPGDDYPLPVQQRESGYDDNAPNAIAGQSFYSLDGTTWNDLATAYGAGNAYVANIHAFESSSSSTLTATASPTTVTVNQNFTINGTLRNGTTGIANATITLQRSTNNATWSNVTTNVTDATGTYQFSNNESAAGTYYYRTAYDGNATYTTATSNTVNVNVTKIPTTLTIAASNTTPVVNQQVTFNATLSNGTTPLSGENITIYHYLNNVRYNDTTNTTNTTGQITVTTSFGSPGQRTYYATFAGDSSYQAKTSSVVTINVITVTKLANALTIAAPASALTKQNFTVNGTLSASAVGIGNATVTLQRSTNNAAWSNVTTNVTDATGTYQFSNNESAAGTYYYRTAYDGNATYTNATSSVVTVNVTKAATALTLTASTTTPAVNQSVTFNATLTSSGAALPSESVTIYHYLNNVRYNDTTNTTNTTGQITVTTSFGSPGQRTYYATFAGDSSYQATTSTVVTVNVTNVTKMQTTITLTASNSTPAVNQQVTFNATLSNGTTPLSGENVTIYHYLNNVRYNDTTNTTNATGQITLTTSFGSPGQRTYYATFAGDSSYQATTSTVVTIIVH
jgi:C1A family cysteine protease